jgi:hypothetical protein
MNPLPHPHAAHLPGLVLLLASGLAGLASCGGKTPDPAPPAGPAASTNQTAYSDMLERSRSKLQEREAENAVVSAIRRFLRDHRRYPTNLPELVFTRYIDAIPVPREGYEYVYQPDRGSLMIQPKGGVRFMNTDQESYEEDEVGAPTLIDGLDVVNP